MSLWSVVFPDENADVPSLKWRARHYFMALAVYSYPMVWLWTILPESWWGALTGIWAVVIAGAILIRGLFEWISNERF